MAAISCPRGLALGDVARVSQVQLLQPLPTVSKSVLLLGQRFNPAVLVAALAVLACVAAAQRARVTARSTRDTSLWPRTIAVLPAEGSAYGTAALPSGCSQSSAAPVSTPA